MALGIIPRAICFLRVGPNVPNTCQGVPNTPPDGTSAMRQTSHHAVSPLAFADYPLMGQ